MRPPTSAICTGIAATALSCVLGAQSREAAPNRVSMTGTASISGRVTGTMADVAGALPSRMAVTDDAGRFTVRNLPAGRFNVSASRPPYLSTSYGAKRLARPGMVSTGTPIALADGQKIADVMIKMAPGAVITGVVRHPITLVGSSRRPSSWASGSSGGHCW